MGLVKGKTSAVPVTERGYGEILADLSAPESGIRRAAARQLALYPESVMAMCDRLDVEGSPSVRAVLLTSLIKLQSPEVAGRLIKYLRSEDASLRNAAIEALQEMPDAFFPHIQALLADPDSDVRIFAVNILGALQHVMVPQWLTDVVRTEQHVNVCAAAVDALAEVGGMESLDALDNLRLRFADEAFMTFAIDTAIRRIRGA